MILKFSEDIEKSISSNPIILSSNIQKYFDPENETVYLKGNLIFIDSSVLEIAIFTSESRHGIHIDKYRFHFIDKRGQMVFRYDNAPHHPKLPSFPSHKHIGNRVISASQPELRDVLNEKAP